MKSNVLFLICTFALLQLQTRAQYTSDVCADPLDAYKITTSVQRGGLHMTSLGAVKALVVFVQFYGETRNPESTQWPLNQQPTYFSSFLDPSPTNPLNNGNLTHFYRRMSFDQFIVYGEPQFAITQYPESHYRGLYGDDAFGEVNREVLQSLDAQVDFGDFDNWTFTEGNPNGHHQSPDGNVDLIIMLYRNIIYPGGQGGSGGAGIAIIGWVGDLVLDGKTIKYGFPGSGVTNGGGHAGQQVSSVRHEVGHLLFGAGHASHGKNVCDEPDQYGFHGITASNPNTTITAYERERMRWINFNDRPAGTSWGSIPDFVTSGVAYRIVIPQTDQAFIIENHQKVDPLFDDPIYIFPGKGLYIYRIDGLDHNHPHYDVMSAEGDYNWSNPYWIPYGGWQYGIIPVFRKIQSNRLGFDARDHLQHTRPDIRFGCLRVFAIEVNGQGVFHERLWGDEKDFYNVGYNQVFSSWSNPASLKQNLSATDIAVEITGKSIGPNGEDIFTATFFNGGAINSSPSKPQDLRVDVYNYSNPHLTWTAAGEPDVLDDGFVLIERRFKPQDSP